MQSEASGINWGNPPSSPHHICPCPSTNLGMGLGLRGDVGLELVAQGGFFYLGCKYLPQGLGGMGYRDVRAWCRSLKGLNGSIPQWVLALRQCTSEGQVVDILREGLGNEVALAGEGVFLAFVRRRWALGRLKRDQVCDLLAELSHECSARIASALRGPKSHLQRGNGDGSGADDASIYGEVDGQLLTFFQQFERYDSLIPKTLW